jgi:hypothetical protein
MRIRAAARAVVVGVVAGSLLGRLAAASEPPDGGLPDGADGAAADAPLAAPPAPAAPGPRAAAPPAPLPSPAPAPSAGLPDPVRRAAEQAQYTQDRWALAYVDRPQTLLEGMDAFSASGRDYFSSSPATYGRLLLGLAYDKALTDWFQVGIAFPWLYCGGTGLGACSPSVRPELVVRGAVVRKRRARLALGASVFDLTYSASAWARLKLVVPHRFSFEIEPSVVLGIQTSSIPAWWSSTVFQDGNQSRAALVLDANLQLTERVLVWADGIPYAPLHDAGPAPGPALQIVGGLGVSFTKVFELAASCRSLNVQPPRSWEYVPHARECGLAFIARGFGPGPEGPVTVPVPQYLY